jgi:LysR family cys regulon transcriptional activator
MYDFIELFAPHLTRKVVDEAYHRQGKAELEEMFANFELPTF